MLVQELQQPREDVLSNVLSHKNILVAVVREDVQLVYDACKQAAYHRSGQFMKVGLFASGLTGLLAGTVIGQSTIRSHQLSCMYKNGYLDYGR